MVKQIARFEYIITDSELEALVLECNLIKEHRPKYNTMLRDDKTIPISEWRSERIFRGFCFPDNRKKTGHAYFGPYTSAGAVKDTNRTESINYISSERVTGICQKISEKTARVWITTFISANAPCQAISAKRSTRQRVDAAVEFLKWN